MNKETKIIFDNIKEITITTEDNKKYILEIDNPKFEIIETKTTKEIKSDNGFSIRNISISANMIDLTGNLKALIIPLKFWEKVNYEIRHPFRRLVGYIKNKREAEE